jgi:hypothetical protein
MILTINLKQLPSWSLCPRKLRHSLPDVAATFGGSGTWDRNVDYHSLTSEGSEKESNPGLLNGHLTTRFCSRW